MRGDFDGLVLESSVSEAAPAYRFHTADGVHSKRSFRDAELLILESLWERDLGRLLSLQGNYGVVGVVLAERAESVCIAESSARATALCSRNARENGAAVTAETVADATTLDAPFDSVAYAPKPYTPLSIGSRRIADGLRVLEPGGTLYLATSKRSGLARYERRLRRMAPTVERVAELGGTTLLAATRPESFDPPTFVSPRTITPTVGEVTLSLRSVPGLFSPASLDDGTRALLETLKIEDGERVLDLCCGYGAVGAYAGRVADCEVRLSDDDRVATACAECSLRASGVEGTVVTADCTDGVTDDAFDRVFCNSPTHAGDGVLSALFSGASRVLAPGGDLTVVHHRTLDLAPQLSAFERVEPLRASGEYVVVRAWG